VHKTGLSNKNNKLEVFLSKSFFFLQKLIFKLIYLRTEKNYKINFIAVISLMNEKKQNTASAK
jgi:hypothetical protein